MQTASIRDNLFKIVENFSVRGPVTLMQRT